MYQWSAYTLYASCHLTKTITQLDVTVQHMVKQNIGRTESWTSKKCVYHIFKSNIKVFSLIKYSGFSNKASINFTELSFTGWKITTIHLMKIINRISIMNEKAFYKKKLSADECTLFSLML